MAIMRNMYWEEEPMEDFIGFYDEGWMVSIDTPVGYTLNVKFQHGRFCVEGTLYHPSELLDVNLCNRRLAKAIRNCFQMNADWETPATGWGKVASALRKFFWRWADRDVVKTLNMLTCCCPSFEGYNMVVKHRFTNFSELIVRFHGSRVFPAGISNLTCKQVEDWRFLSTRLKQIEAYSLASIVSKIPAHVKAEDLWSKIPKDSWKFVQRFGGGCLLRDHLEVATLREERSKRSRDKKLAFVRGKDKLQWRACRRILLKSHSPEAVFMGDKRRPSNYSVSAKWLLKLIRQEAAKDIGNYVSEDLVIHIETFDNPQWISFWQKHFSKALNYPRVEVFGEQINLQQLERYMTPERLSPGLSWKKSLENFFRAYEDDTRVTGPLPAPPVTVSYPGWEITPFTRAEEVSQRGREHHHCVGGYVRPIIEEKVFCWSVQKGKTVGTLRLQKSGKKWIFAECRGKFNVDLGFKPSKLVIESVDRA